jgi:uncharacterized GH25 family protein
MSRLLPPRRRRARGARRTLALAVLMLLAAVAIASAHDMFVKPARFFVEENAQVVVRLLNGTFTKSENSIARARLRDVSVVSPDGRAQLDTAEWGVAGDTSTLRARTGGPGTYVIAVSTAPNVIALKAKDFNLYLREDGIPDVLEARRTGGELDRPARERYSKHVKALLQVGKTPSDHYATELGYPAELVPIENPYALDPGGVLRVRTLVDGKPAGNQYVLYGGRTPTGGRVAPRSVRSDADGVARVRVGAAGTWYVKFIHMTRLENDAEADYESKWATLTFQRR